MTRTMLSVIRMVPGVLLLAAIGFAGKLTEFAIAAYGKAHHVALPNIEYVLWAILFGLALNNLVPLAAVFRPGVDTYEFWLKLGIVFQGVRFLLGDVLKLGSLSLLFVAVELALSIVLMTWLGRRFGLNEKLTSLLAIGSSICCSKTALSTGSRTRASRAATRTAPAAPWHRQSPRASPRR